MGDKILTGDALLDKLARGPYVSNPNYNPKTKKGRLEPQYLLDTSAGDIDSGMLANTASNIRNMQFTNRDLGMTNEDVEESERLGISASPYNSEEERNKALAKNQSWTEQFGNFLMQAGVGEGMLGIMEGFGNIYDGIINSFTGDNWDQSAYTRYMHEAKENFQNQYQIHQEDPNAAFNLGDWGWWFQNAVSVATTLSLMVPAAGYAKALGMLGKATRLSNLGRNISKVASRGIAKATSKFASNATREVAGSGFAGLRKVAGRAGLIDKQIRSWSNAAGTALLSRTGENFMEGREVYEDVYTNSKQNLENMPDEEFAKFLVNNPEFKGMEKDDIAKEIARKSANKTFYNDYGMLIMDIFQFKALGSLWGGARGTTTAAQRIAKNNAVKRLAGVPEDKLVKNTFLNRRKEAAKYALKHPWSSFELSESVEEIYQGIQSGKGMDVATKYFDPSFTPRTVDSFLSDASIWEQGFWGAIGGVAFGGFGRGIQRATHAAQGLYNKKHMTAEQYERWKRSSDKIAVEQLDSSTERAKSFIEEMNMIDNGINPYEFVKDPVTKRKIVKDGGYVHETVSEEQKQAMKESAIRRFVDNETLEAIDNGTYDLMKEILGSKEFDKFVTDSGHRIDPSDKELSQSVVDRMEEVAGIYNSALVNVANVTDDENPFVTRAAARNATRNALRLQNSDLKIEDLDRQIQAELEKISGDTDFNEEYEQRLTFAINDELRNLDRELDGITAAYENKEDPMMTKSAYDQWVSDINRRKRELMQLASTTTKGSFAALGDMLKENNADEEIINEFNRIADEITRNAPGNAAPATVRELYKNRARAEVERSHIAASMPVTDDDYRNMYDELAGAMDKIAIKRVNDNIDKVKDYLLNADDYDEAKARVFEENTGDEEVDDALHELKFGYLPEDDNPSSIKQTQSFLQLSKVIAETDKARKNMEKEAADAARDGVTIPPAAPPTGTAAQPPTGTAAQPPVVPPVVPPPVVPPPAAPQTGGKKSPPPGVPPTGGQRVPVEVGKLKVGDMVESDLFPSSRPLVVLKIDQGIDESTDLITFGDAVGKEISFYGVVLKGHLFKPSAPSSPPVGGKTGGTAPAAGTGGTAGPRGPVADPSVLGGSRPENLEEAKQLLKAGKFIAMRAFSGQEAFRQMLADEAKKEKFISEVAAFAQCGMDTARKAFENMKTTLEKLAPKGTFKGMAQRAAIGMSEDASASAASTGQITGEELDKVIDGFLEKYNEEVGNPKVGGKSVINLSSLFNYMLDNSVVDAETAAYIYDNVMSYVQSNVQDKYMFTGYDAVVGMNAERFLNMLREKKKQEVANANCMHIFSDENKDNKFMNAVQKAAIEGKGRTYVEPGYDHDGTLTHVNIMVDTGDGKPVCVGFLRAVKRGDDKNTIFVPVSHQSGFRNECKLDPDGGDASRGTLDCDGLFEALIDHSAGEAKTLFESLVKFRMEVHRLIAEEKDPIGAMTDELADAIMDSPLIKSFLDEGHYIIPESVGKNKKDQARHMATAITNILFYGEAYRNIDPANNVRENTMAIDKNSMANSYARWKRSVFKNYELTEKLQKAASDKENHQVDVKLNAKTFIDFEPISDPDGYVNVSENSLNPEDHPMVMVDKSGNLVGMDGKIHGKADRSVGAYSLGFVVYSDDERPNPIVAYCNTALELNKENPEMVKSLRKEIEQLIGSQLGNSADGKSKADHDKEFDRIFNRLLDLFGPGGLFVCGDFSVVADKDRNYITVKKKVGNESRSLFSLHKKNRDGTPSNAVTVYSYDAATGKPGYLVLNKPHDGSKKTVRELLDSYLSEMLSSVRINRSKNAMDGKISFAIGGKSYGKDFSEFVLGSRGFNMNLKGENGKFAMLTFDPFDLTIDMKMSAKPAVQVKSTALSDLMYGEQAKKKRKKKFTTEEVLKAAGVSDKQIAVITGENSAGLNLAVKNVYSSEEENVNAYYKDGKVHLTRKGALSMNGKPRNAIRLVIHENIHRQFRNQRSRGYVNSEQVTRELLEVYEYTRRKVEEDMNSGKIKRSLYNDIIAVFDTFMKEYEGNSQMQMEEFLVECLTQPALMDYLNETEYSEEVDVEGIPQSRKSLFQKIIDILLKLFYGDDYAIKNSSILAKEYQILAKGSEIERREKAKAKARGKQEEPMLPFAPEEPGTEAPASEAPEEDGSGSDEGFDFRSAEELEFESPLDDTSEDYPFAATELIGEEEEDGTGMTDSERAGNARGIKTAGNMNDFVNRYPARTRPIMRQLVEKGILNYSCS